MPIEPLPHLKPFLIEHRRQDESPTSFIPEARLIISAALRTCGLLAALSDEQARTLLALLTFLSPNGVLEASAADVAGALALPERVASKRLERLTSVQLADQALVFPVPRGSGSVVYAVAPPALTHEEALPLSCPVPLGPAADREAVVTHSRMTYGRPRALAEAMVEEQLGHSPEERADTPEGDARRRLLAIGVSKEEVERLLSEYPIEEIRRQLEWLPERGARNPARFIVAAIRGSYAPPLGLRLASDSGGETSSDPVPPPNLSGEVSLPVPAVPEGGQDEQ